MAWGCERWGGFCFAVPTYSRFRLGKASIPVSSVWLHCLIGVADYFPFRLREPSQAEKIVRAGSSGIEWRTGWRRESDLVVLCSVDVLGLDSRRKSFWAYQISSSTKLSLQQPPLSRHDIRETTCAWPPKFIMRPAGLTNKLPFPSRKWRVDVSVARANSKSHPNKLTSQQDMIGNMGTKISICCTGVSMSKLVTRSLRVQMRWVAYGRSLQLASRFRAAFKFSLGKGLIVSWEE